MNVGTVTATIAGDETSLRKATTEAVEDLKKLTRAGEDLKRTTDKLRPSAEAMQRATVKWSQSADVLARQKKLLVDRTKSSQERVEKLATATTGLTSAFGGLGGKIGATFGALSNVGSALLSGGPLLAGMATLAFLAGLAGAELVQMRAEAQALSRVMPGLAQSLNEHLKKSLDDSRKSLQDLQTELRNFGKTSLEVQRDDNVARAQMALVASERAGERVSAGEALIRRLKQELRLAEEAGVSGKAQRLRDELATEQAIVNTLKARIQLRQAEAEIASDLAVAAQQLIDKRKTAASIAADANDVDAPALFGANPTMSTLTEDQRIALAMTRTPAISNPGLLELGDPTAKFRSLSGELALLEDRAAATRAVFSTGIKTQEEYNKELAKATREMEEWGRAQGRAIASLLDAAYRGQGFSAAGAEVGGAVGGAIGGAFGLAGEGVGGAIGAFLGGVAGNLLDELVSVLGVLTPLFDALAIVVRALSPIFLVLREFTLAFGGSLERIAPIIHPLAEVVAVLLLGFVRFLQVLLLFNDFVLVAMGFVTNALTQWVVTLAQNLDTFVLRPLLEAVNVVYNGFVDVVNTLTNWIRGWTMDDSFGLILSHRQVPANDVIGDQFATTEWGIGQYGEDALWSWKDSTEDNTDAIRELTRTITNIPGGYRVSGAEYDTSGNQIASPMKRGGGSSSVSSAPMLYIQTAMFAALTASEQMRRESMRKSGNVYGGRPRHPRGN